MKVYSPNICLLVALLLTRTEKEYSNLSVLCYCVIETENHFLLESLAACPESPSNITMYFTVNLAFNF